MYPPEPLGVGVVSTFPPRKCGIATFTRDLTSAFRALPSPSEVYITAINGTGQTGAYPPEVIAQIDEADPASYVATARMLNRMLGVDVVSVQHDFGKFGVWRDCFAEDYLAPMLAALQKPVVITLHSVPRAPNALMRRTMQIAGRLAAAIVVMAEAARAIMRVEYQLDPGALARVMHIPHGVPLGAADRLPTSIAKETVGMAGRRVLSTFGFLSEGKGIEYVIQAMPDLIRRYPDLVYLVIGQTHPDICRLEGEQYRDTLVELSRALGVQQHVQFIDHFLPVDAIFRYLRASDVYVTPYLTHDQITSGTLAYALAAGKAIVSTPYLYAQEVLAGGRGLLAPFRDPDAMARAVDLLLGNAELRNQYERAAATYGEGMMWSSVAARYRDLFANVATARLPRESSWRIATSMPSPRGAGGLPTPPWPQPSLAPSRPPQ